MGCQAITNEVVESADAGLRADDDTWSFDDFAPVAWTPGSASIVFRGVQKRVVFRDREGVPRLEMADYEEYILATLEYRRGWRVIDWRRAGND